MHKEPLNSMMPKEIIDSFDGHAGAGYVTVISGADLVIGKSGGETVVSAKYQVVKPLFGNLSVLMDFEAASNSK
jgi:hypothetical protein